MSKDEKDDQKDQNKKKKDDDNKGDDNNDDDDEMEDRKKRLEKGDYVVQCHIIEARDLKARDFGDTSDPVCQVVVMGKKKSTQIHQKCLTVIFDERLTYDFKGLEPEELNQGKCIINCYDANVIRSNVLIGSFEFDLTQIYYKKHHELYQQWVALTDVTGAEEGVQGYLQVTIVVLGPKDEQYIHPDGEEFDTSGSLLNVMMPPQVETDPHLLKVHIHQLDKLMIMDKLTKSSDPYVLVKFAGVENKTSVFKKKLDPHIHEIVTIPVMEPLLGNTIILHVKDHDVGLKDDIIGTFTFSYTKIKKNKMLPKWVHMYGAPSGKQKGIADKMNRAILPGTTYRGSMLLSMDVESEPKDDELKIECIKGSWHKKQAPKIKQWVLQVDVYQGVEVGDGKGKFKIKMMIRDLKINTDYVSCTKGSCEWYEILRLPDSDNKEDTIDLRMPANANECPDVIFYLIEKKSGFDVGSDNIISYKRFSWQQLLDLGFGSAPEWYTFTASDVLHKMGEEDFPGTILLGLRAGLKDAKPKFGVPVTARPFLNISDQDSALDQLKNTVDDNKTPEPSISSKSNSQQPLLPGPDRTRTRSKGIHPSKHGAAETMGQLQVTVVNAQNVPALDRSGTSDPYVEITVNGTNQKTSVQKDTLRPTWNETFTFNGISIHDSITMQLNDWNRFGKKTKIGKIENIILMGLLQEAKGQLGVDFNYTKKFFVSEKYANCTITISISFDFDAKQAQQRKEKKKDFTLFQAVKKSNLSSSSRSAGVAIMGRPYPRNYKMVVYVYQARNLAALDASGFSDPYFEVTYCGKRTKTATIKKTLNPQWMEALTLNVDVPQPAKYAPRIRCSVYDWDRFSGNDLIGRFFIPFTDVIDMMIKKKPRWYQISDQNNEKMEGRVYIAVEFIDANQKTKPIFKIDKTANPFFLHLLTIGVRGMKSALGVHKPQIVYTAPLADYIEEIATDPSSNPSTKDLVE